MKYEIGKRCKGCRITCGIVDVTSLVAYREGCPCFECLIKVMCTYMCGERVRYYREWCLERNRLNENH